ncbi:MAG: calcium/sodium antiporter [Gammaproteobacteria bacterium]|nr:MAG: calcium/sodium antiporter [Gammaproteobacteria bacterium]
MIMYVSAILGGLILLIWGAERMVTGAGVTARNLGVSPMLIGLTVVGFATSAPEILVSATAALDGVPNLAVGNALGSNIANMGLIIGLTALIWPLVVASDTLHREFPVMVLITIVPIIVFWNGHLSRFDGVVLLLAFIAYFCWIVRLGMRTRGHDSIEAEYAAEIPTDMSMGRALLWVVIGLAVLAAGSIALVWGSENVALEFGVSNLVIGVTIVAVGTSLPELAVSVVAARKGEYGLAFGNVLGSNGFNMLAVLGVAAVIGPIEVEPDVFSLHLPVLLGFTVAFFFMAYNRSGSIRVSRLSGGLLLAGFVGYYSYLGYQTF